VELPRPSSSAPFMATNANNMSGLEQRPPIAAGRYVLVTAAYNEEAHIAKTIESVLSQTRLPTLWVIVSDGSVDRTDEIVQSYANKHGLIRFLRVERAPGRSFGSKVRALHAGNALLKGVDYDFIGNLDADVSVSSSYFEGLLSRFLSRPLLGLAGGFVVEESKGEFRDRAQNRVYSVAHAGQVVRRECYEAIGGYAILEYGGEDWHAQTCAKMKGWEVEAFPDLKIFHHRHTGEADNLLRHKFRQGRMDYSFGSYPPFEMVKCAAHARVKPFLLGSLFRISGFVWAWARQDERPVSDEFVAYLRREQKGRLSAVRNVVRKTPKRSNRPSLAEKNLPE
jgi:biofilm PGA synthesis N-glycosyltransferase PgaC